MSNSLVNTRDQRFVLYEQIGIENLFEYDKYADYSMDMVDMVLTEAEKFALEEILPTYEIADKEDPAVFKDGKAHAPKCYHKPFKNLREAGWFCPLFPVEVGGQGMPKVLSTANSEMFGSANYSFMMYVGLTLGAAGLIMEYGTEEQKNKYLYKMCEGLWGGTMCLTEPGAGSDVGASRASAKRLPDGTYSITGTKCFISSGDHDLTENIIHPVLARIEGDPPGTKGISIFIVPKIRVNDDGSLGEPNDVITGNIEHKMGIKGSATATLNFGENGNCIGELLGNEREGMKIMFKMMNEARLDVGVQGQSIASAAYEHAVQYAKERIQGTSALAGKDGGAVTIINHAPVRRNLLWMKTYLEGVRALNYFTGFCIDVAEASDSEEERKKYHGLVELLTPVCKAFSSDRGVEICSRAMDVYGGYGYCQEYPVEQYLRDCKITQIYEGTNQIQALDLVGRKLGMNGGMNFMTLLGEIAATVKKLKGVEDLKSSAAKLEEACGAMAELPLAFIEFFKAGKAAVPIQNVEPFLTIMGDVVCGWLLLQGAGIALEKLASLDAGDADVPFYKGKVISARFFAAEILPTVKIRCEIIKENEALALEIAEESFAV
jgi:alkylation response protein AidB-like acyl-CoA dehydrogenase